MATGPATGRFYLAGLRSLRAAEREAPSQINSIWDCAHAGQFEDFSQDVNTFSGFRLKGYRMDDTPVAFDACSQTLDALEDLSGRMNQSTKGCWRSEPLLHRNRNFAESRPTWMRRGPLSAKAST